MNALQLLALLERIELQGLLNVANGNARDFRTNTRPEETDYKERWSGYRPRPLQDMQGWPRKG